jgi:hypothetical protein
MEEPKHPQMITKKKGNLTQLLKSKAQQTFQRLSSSKRQLKSINPCQFYKSLLFIIWLNLK